MQELVAWYNETAQLPDINPIVLASLFHHKFVAIHPFDDGNGRMTRLLTNYILLKFGYPVSVLITEKRLEYYGALSQADNDEIIPIIEMIAESVKESLQIYLKAINGDDISEADDIDKKIELFKKESGVFKNGYFEFKEVDLGNFIFHLVQFPSSKYRHLAQTFNTFSERIISKNKINSKSLSFGSNAVDKLETYKTIANNFDGTLSIIYTVTFQGSVVANKSIVIKSRVEISFRKLNYTISDTLGNTIVKTYLEKVEDDKYARFVMNSVDRIISEVKK